MSFVCNASVSYFPKGDITKGCSTGLMHINCFFFLSEPHTPSLQSSRYFFILDNAPPELQKTSQVKLFALVLPMTSN